MSRRPIRQRFTPATRRIALAATLLLALGACRNDPDPDPLLQEPALVVDGEALARLLARLAQLSDTPAGRSAKQLEARLAGCSVVTAHFAPTPQATESARPSPLDRLVCRDAVAEPDALASHLSRARGERDGYLQWPIAAAGRVELRFDVDAHGGLALEAMLQANDETLSSLGALAYLVPDEVPPAPARLDLPEALVHLRLRSQSGSGLAHFVAEGSQGDRLFALKGRLLEAALLEGTLELALLPPTAGRQVPVAVAALHHRGAAALEPALAEALAQLRATWAIEPSTRAFATSDGSTRSGGCYADLPLLPELAPCWVVTQDALFVGYRPEAIEAALAARPVAAGTTGTATGALGAADVDSAGAVDPRSQTSGLVVDFERIRALDERLAGPGPVADATGGARRLADLYAQLELTGTSGADGMFRIAGRLRARP